MACCLSLIGRCCFCPCRCPCPCWNTLIAALPLASPGRNQINRCPASTTSAAAPLSRPLLKRQGGDRVSLQLIRHFLVATTADHTYPDGVRLLSSPSATAEHCFTDHQSGM